MNLAGAALAETVDGGWGAWAALFVNPRAPGFWLLVDLLAAIGVGLLLAGVSSRRRNLLRAGRWVVVPFLALTFGAVSPQTMGLAGTDRVAALRLGLPLVAGLLLLLTLARLAVRGDAPRGAAQAPPLRPSEPGAVPFAILYAGGEQLHWCFQRAALLVIVAALPNAPANAAYWATWAAMLLALPGLLLLPSGWGRLWTFVALAATAILFFYTRNFWLCWALHAGTLLLAGAGTVRTARREVAIDIPERQLP